MLIDNNISPEQNILNHINAALGSSVPDIELHEVSFGLPKPIKPKVDDSLIPEGHPNSEYIHNTELTVTSNRTGEVYLVNYRRVNIPKQWKILSGKVSLELPINNLDDDSEIRAEIKKVWDFYDSEIVTTIEGVGNTRKYTFKAKENSLLYVEGLGVYNPSDITVDITVTKTGSGPIIPPNPPKDGKTPLGDIINDTVMDSDGTKSNEGDGFEYH